MGLPGYGDTGQLSSGVTDKRTADQMEWMLERLATRALSDPRARTLLDMVCRRVPKNQRVDLPTLFAAYNRGEEGALALAATDPPIRQVADRISAENRSLVLGTKKVLLYFGSAARMSALTTARIQACLEAYEAGHGGYQPAKRNTVIRQVKRAISGLLTRHVGRQQAGVILSGVDFPGEDDTREVALSRGELKRLLSACPDAHPEMRAVVLAAMLTSADRGVLLTGKSADGRWRGLLRRDVSIYQEGDGSYSVEIDLTHDTKSKARARMSRGGDVLARELLPLAQLRTDDEPLFSIRYEQWDYNWNKVREAANLPGLRMKDLRAQFAILGERAGVPTALISNAMGHSHEAMTARYQRHAAGLSREHARAIEALLPIAA